MLPQKRKRREQSSKDLLGLGVKPESHERALVGLVRFGDGGEGDPCSREAFRLAMQGELVGDSQNHRMGSFGEVSRARFSGRVHEVRGLNPPWEVRANDDVVAERP